MTNNQLLTNITTSQSIAPSHGLCLGLGIGLTQACMQNNYPKNEFPEVMRNMIDAVETKTKAPAPLIGTFMLSTSGEAIQGGYTLQAPNEMPSPLALWGMVFADSGSGKTPVINMLRKPITDFETIARNEYSEKLRLYETNHQIWKAKYTALKNQFNKAIRNNNEEEEIAAELAEHIEAEPTKPRLIKLTYQDTTPEALCFGLFENWPNAALVYDEGSVFLNGRMTDHFGLLNKLWELAPLEVSRRNHTEELFVPDPRLSITLGIQPGALDRYLRRRGTEGRDLGLFARTLVCMPRESRWKDTTYSTSDSPDTVDCFYRRLTELLATGVDAAGEPVKEKKIVTFGAEAASRFIEYRKWIESELNMLGGKLKQIPDFGNKLSRHAARLAANFELIQTGNTVISHEMLQRAINVMNWYIDEYHRIFAPPPEPPQHIKDAATMMDKLNVLSKRWETRYLPKSLVQSHAPGALRNDGRANPALMHLHITGQIKMATYDRIEYIDMQPGWADDYDHLRAVINEHRRKRKYDFSVKSFLS